MELFFEEISKLKNNNNNLIKSNLGTIFYLLKKYTSSIPSAAYVSEADISLFDHSKTTAALATCRYLFSKEKNLHQTNHQEVYLLLMEIFQVFKNSYTKFHHLKMHNQE